MRRLTYVDLCAGIGGMRAGLDAAGWSCRYYRPAAPFSSNYVYRLCFANGALVAKTVVQSGSVPPTPEGNR